MHTQQKAEFVAELTHLGDAVLDIDALELEPVNKKLLQHLYAPVQGLGKEGQREVVSKWFRTSFSQPSVPVITYEYLIALHLCACDYLIALYLSLPNRVCTIHLRSVADNRGPFSTTVLP